MAQAMPAYGLPWTTGRVGDFESGRVAPSLPTLFVVAAALGDVIGRPVSLAELFDNRGIPEFDGSVAINGDLVVKLSKLRAALSDQPVELEVKLNKTGADAALPKQVTRVLREFRESDARMCKNVGVTEDVGAAAMSRLWKRTFSAERDRLAGPDANAQRKGQISRQLKAELQRELADGR